MWIVGQQCFPLPTAAMKQFWGACKSTLHTHSPCRRHKDCHSMGGMGRRHHKVAAGLVPAWHLALPFCASPCRAGLRVQRIIPRALPPLGLLCAATAPSTCWLLTAGPSCKVGSWLDLHLVSPVLCRKGLQRGFLSSPWSLWKGEGHANAKQQNIRC